MKKWQVENSKVFKTPDELVKILLKTRGIKTKKEIEDFLNPKLSNITLDYVDLDRKQIKKGIKRIEEAIKKREKIIVFGDYDVDGITGAAILWETLNKLKANVLPYIPNRFDEGYGLSKEGIDNLLKTGDIGLIITVDNGIVAIDAVEYANKKGIDVIITDHHAKATKLPKALSIIHSILLCGAGVAYVFAKEISKEKMGKEDDLLELVVLATIADLVPLTNANRILVHFGLKSLQKTKRPGLLALINNAKIEKEAIGTYEIGHIIAPRLNAMGRISSAMDSLRLICTTSKKRADDLSELLSKTNLERQQVTQDAISHASKKVKEKAIKNLIFIADKSYQQGVVGLVAGRMVEEFYLPSIVISKGEKYSKASARSVKGFNIIEFLRTASDLLVDVGGHPMAAGFTVETDKLELLEKKLFKSAEKLLKKEHLERILRIDSKLDSDLINQQTFSAILKLKPFGMNNPEPTFLTEDLKIESIRFLGQEGKHMKLNLSKGNRVFDAIHFGAGNRDGLKLGDNVNAVYTIDENNWNGNKNLQLKIKDLKIN